MTPERIALLYRVSRGETNWTERAPDIRQALHECLCEIERLQRGEFTPAELQNLWQLLGECQDEIERLQRGEFTMAETIATRERTECTSGGPTTHLKVVER